MVETRPPVRVSKKYKADESINVIYDNFSGKKRYIRNLSLGTIPLDGDIFLTKQQVAKILDVPEQKVSKYLPSVSVRMLVDGTPRYHIDRVTLGFLADEMGIENMFKDSYTYEELKRRLKNEGKLPKNCYTFGELIEYGVFKKIFAGLYTRESVENYLKKLDGYVFLSDALDELSKESGKHLRAIHPHVCNVNKSRKYVKNISEVFGIEKNLRLLVVKRADLDKLAENLESGRMRNIDDGSKGHFKIKGQFGYWSLYSALEPFIEKYGMMIGSVKTAAKEKRVGIPTVLVAFATTHYTHLLENSEGDGIQTRYKLSYKNMLVLRARMLMDWAKTTKYVDKEVVDEIAENIDLISNPVEIGGFLTEEAVSHFVEAGEFPTDFAEEFLHFLKEDERIGLNDIEEPAYEEEFEHVITSESLGMALATLEDREKCIVEKRYLEKPPMTLEGLRKEMGINSKERVRQIEEDAIRKLKHPTRQRILLGEMSGDEYRKFLEYLNKWERYL